MEKAKFQRSLAGELMLLIGLLVLAPLLVLPFYPQDAVYAASFLVPGLFSVLLGLFFFLFFKKPAFSRVSWRDSVGRSSLTVLFAWSWGVLFGALPFILSGQLSVVQGLFEAVSGWTTTGLSVIDVSRCSHIFLFHRSFMQYCGGLGFIMVMILFISGKSAAKLYSAEGHPDHIMPNITRTARAIFIIYNICLVLGTVAYRLAGMNWFDGICHTMCSLSTGGFSTRLASIGAYHSLAIEIITIVLMLIGTTNFAALLLLFKGRVRDFFRVSEVRFMFLMLFLLILPTALSLSDGLGISFWEGLRKASFDISSAMSTTGYSTMSYAQWPQFAIAMLIIAMLMGGGIGSTAGGLKLSRVYLMLRLTALNIRKRLSPARHVSAPSYCKADGKVPIDRDLAEDTSGFVTSYLVIFLLGSLALTLTADCTFVEAMFDFSSSLGTVGLSIGITGPDTNSASLIVEMVGMLLGRLEIFIVLTGIAFGFGKVKRGIAAGFCRLREKLHR